MDYEITEKKLKEMHLSKLADEYNRQRNDITYQNRSFDDRLYELVSAEYDSRYNNTVKRYIAKAEFSCKNANLNDVNYNPDRKLDKQMIESLRTNDYIESQLNIIVIGASGCGKTWLSCAFGVNACQSKYRVKYYRLPELFSEFEAQKIQGRYRQYLSALGKYDLMILDEFLLTSTTTSERENLLELIESRTNKKSTIYCSQWTPSGWHEKLGGGAVADAILDRIVNSSYMIELKGNSLREEYSKLK